MKILKSLGVICLGLVLILTNCDKGAPVDAEDKKFEAGPILFVSDKSGSWQLYSMNEDGSDVTQLTDDVNFPVTDAQWSPDGTKIAFTSRDDRLAIDQRSSAIYVMSRDGTGRYKLTNPPIEAFSDPFDIRPVWSPDGSKLAFSRLMPPEISGDFDILIVDVNGGNERRITSNRNLLELVAGWFPDGGELLTSYFDYSRTDSSGAADGKGQIARLDTAGNDMVLLSPYDSHDSGPVLSPNGSSVVFSSRVDFGLSLFLMDASGTGRRELSKTMHKYETPVDWSPDGQSVLYNGEDDQLQVYENPPRFIEILDLVKDTVRSVTPFDYKSANYRATSWRRR